MLIDVQANGVGLWNLDQVWLSKIYSNSISYMKYW